MSKNTGDGELKKILIDYLGTAWRAYEDGLIAPAPLSKAKTAINKLIAQEANKAQQQLLQELMEQADTYCTHYIMMRDMQKIPTKIEAIPLSVIQNKLEGLS